MRAVVHHSSVKPKVHRKMLRDKRPMRKKNGQTNHLLNMFDKKNNE
jgi:hypothetical protein